VVAMTVLMSLQTDGEPCDLALFSDPGPMAILLVAQKVACVSCRFSRRVFSDRANAV